MAIEDDRLVGPSRRREEAEAEATLRPAYLREYIGQQRVKEKLGVFVQAAKVHAFAGFRRPLLPRWSASPAPSRHNAWPEPGKASSLT